MNELAFVMWSPRFMVVMLVLTVVRPVNAQDDSDNVPYTGITRTDRENPYRAYMRNVRDPEQSLRFCEAVRRNDKRPLVEVNISKSMITDEGAQLLRDSPAPLIWISNTEISTAGVEMLLASKNLGSLIIYGVAVPKLNLSVLSAEGSHVSGLRVTKSDVDDETLLSLGKIERPFSLTLLNGKIRGPGLAGLGNVPRLTSLELGGNPLDDDGLAVLPNLPKLTHLDLSRSKITDVGLAHLSPMPELTQLDLSDTAIIGKELQVFAESKKLFAVNLKGTKLTDEGMAKLPTWPLLKDIDLSGTMITDDGLRTLRGTDKLRYVKVSRTNISEEAMSEFSKAWPEVLIANVRVDKSGVEFHRGVRRSWTAKTR